MSKEIVKIQANIKIDTNCEHFYTMYHTGGLKEALKTIWEISKDAYLRLIATELYKPYNYDERIKAYRWMLKDIEHNLGLPQWLLASEEELY